MNPILDRASEADIAEVTRQLGRPARGIVAIGARCVCGRPLVAATSPRLPDGTPFPTTFYLTHPAATAAVSRLEAAGEMAGMSERVANDEELAAKYLAAHRHYLAARQEVGRLAGVGEVPEIDDFSAGGMPVRVKCLHALVGHALAAGPGVNPIGDEALERIEQWWSPERCVCEVPVPEAENQDA